MKGFASLTLSKLCHRNTGPLGDDPGNLIFGNAFMHQAQILASDLLFLGSQLLLQLGKLSVLQLCGPVKVVFLLCVLNLPVHSLDLFAERRKLIYRSLFILPLCFLRSELIVKFRQLLLQIRQTILA